MIVCVSVFVLLSIIPHESGPSCVSGPCLGPGLVSGSRASADDGDSVCVEDHACGRFVGAGQVVEVLAVGVTASMSHLLVLLHADHQALMADRLHVVLIAVR